VSAFAYQGTNAHAIVVASTPLDQNPSWTPSGRQVDAKWQVVASQWGRASEARPAWVLTLAHMQLLRCCLGSPPMELKSPSDGGPSITLEVKLNAPGNAFLWDHRILGKALFPGNNNNNNNNNYYYYNAYAGATDSFTYLRVLLVLTDRGILAQSN
jgi:hypothetical protein